MRAKGWRSPRGDVGVAEAIDLSEERLEGDGEGRVLAPAVRSELGGERGDERGRGRAAREEVRMRRQHGAEELDVHRVGRGPGAAAAADEVLQMVDGDAVPTGLPPTALLTA